MQSAFGSIIPPGVEIFRVDTNLASFGYGIALSLEQGLVIFDTVSYRYDWFGLNSWPTAADGEALALTRIDPTRYGNDPNNWQAVPPSPGK